MPLTPEQLLQRQKGLGGSDCAAALGLSPWKTPYELYEEKRAATPPVIEMNEAMRWGTLLEPVIRQEYANLTGRAVATFDKTLVSETHPFMLATPDGIVNINDPVTSRRLFEAKTAWSDQDWGEPGTDQIPSYYVLQVQHYMVVTGIAVADVAVLINGRDFRLYEVPADPELQQMIVEGEREFWQRVETGQPPEIDLNAPGALDLVRRLHRNVVHETVTADALLDGYRMVCLDAAKQATEYQAMADSAKAHLLAALKDADELKFADGTVLRRKVVTRKGYVVEPSTYVDVRWIKPKE